MNKERNMQFYFHIIDTPEWEDCETVFFLTKEWHDDNGIMGHVDDPDDDEYIDDSYVLSTIPENIFIEEEEHLCYRLGGSVEDIRSSLISAGFVELVVEE